MDENLFDLYDFEDFDEDDCDYLEEYVNKEKDESEEEQNLTIDDCNVNTYNKIIEQLNLDWEDFSSDNYCKNKCEFYKTCYSNREICLKKAFKDVLETLTPREEKVLKLYFGFNDNKPKTLDEISKMFSITCERIRQITAKALRKLRHPSRAKMFINRKFDIYSASIYFYRNLLNELMGQEDNKTLVEIKLGLDYSIIDREKSFNKSISTIKTELETKICDIDELSQYSETLYKQNIYSLKDLLYSSMETIIKSFDYDDYIIFSFQKKLLDMGYKIKTTSYKSEREYFNNYYIEFLGFNLFSNIDNQNLIDSALPSGIVAKLLENEITTTSKLLFDTSKYEIKNIINDDEKAKEIFMIIKQYKPNISLDKYNIYNLYVDSKFISYFYWNLFDELHINNYSAKSLHLEMKRLKITSFYELINCIEKNFSNISVEKLFVEYMVDKEILQKTIEEMDLSIRTYNCLKRANIHTVEELIEKTEDDMLKVRNLGLKSLHEIIKKLDEYGLKLQDGYEE